MPADYTRLHRLLAIIQLIAGKHGLTSRNLALNFAVDERTIRRDIETLNLSGFPISHDPASAGYIIRKGFLMPPIEFSFEEALSLLILMEQIPADSKIPYQTTAHRALQKLRSQFREDIKNDLEPLDGNIHIDLARGSGDDGSKDVYHKVRAAIATRRTLHCRYDATHSTQKTANEKTFDFRPYALWYAQRAWYAVGLHCGRNEIRNLKLNRFDFIQPTEKPYAIPDDFSMKSHLGNAWRMIRGQPECRVRIRFDKAFAETVSETRWHPSQKETWHKNGSLTLTFQVAGLDEIKWFILAYGPHAHVLQPPQLANEIQSLAQATARRYTTKR